MKLRMFLCAIYPNFIRDLGRIYFLAGRYPEALNILTAFESLAPNHPKRLFYLGRTQMKVGQFKDAAVAFEKLISIYPEYPEVYYFLGETWGKLDKLHDAHYYLGIHYKKISDFKTAAVHLKKALEKMDNPEKKVKIEVMLIEIRKKKHK